MDIKFSFDKLVESTRSIHNATAGWAKSAVNQSLTVRNWIIGCYIVEYEQNGNDRAEYGVRLLEDIAADIITLIRRYAIGSHLLSYEERIKGAVARLKKAHSFSAQELSWLKRMEKYLLEESVLTVQALDEDSRFRAQGGFARIDKIFAGQLEKIIAELNEYLYDDGGSAA